jgi:hypothetical protein
LAISIIEANPSEIVGQVRAKACERTQAGGDEGRRPV